MIGSPGIATTSAVHDDRLAVSLDDGERIGVLSAARYGPFPRRVVQRLYANINARLIHVFRDEPAEQLPALARQFFGRLD